MRKRDALCGVLVILMTSATISFTYINTYHPGDPEDNVRSHQKHNTDNQRRIRELEQKLMHEQALRAEAQQQKVALRTTKDELSTKTGLIEPARAVSGDADQLRREEWSASSVAEKDSHAATGNRVNKGELEEVPDSAPMVKSMPAEESSDQAAVLRCRCSTAAEITLVFEGREETLSVKCDNKKIVSTWSTDTEVTAVCSKPASEWWLRFGTFGLEIGAGAELQLQHLYATVTGVAALKDIQVKAGTCNTTAIKDTLAHREDFETPVGVFPDAKTTVAAVGGHFNALVAASVNATEQQKTRVVYMKTHKTGETHPGGLPHACQDTNLML